MSVDVFVFVREPDLPSREEWQAAIDELGIDLQLDERMEPDSASGYWPVKIRGEASGFEFFSGSAEVLFGSSAPSGAGDRSLTVDLVTHSDIRELECSLLAGAALALVADGVVYDEETNRATSHEALLELAQSIAS